MTGFGPKRCASRPAGIRPSAIAPAVADSTPLAWAGETPKAWANSGSIGWGPWNIAKVAKPPTNSAHLAARCAGVPAANGGGRAAAEAAGEGAVRERGTEDTVPMLGSLA